MKHIKWLLSIVLVMFLIVVIAENIPNLKTPVSFGINLYIFDYRTPDFPIGFLAALTFLVGVLAMAVCGMAERFRLKKQIKMLTRENQEAAKEIASLKNLSVTTEAQDLKPVSDLDESPS